jgi:ABC-type cobalamin/Fe3+-siderophores transport system ATPase subunit
MIKIIEYTIENFRGVAGSITVELTKPPSRSAQSLILYGDNGSGKSSLVDALEFALRGRLSRRSTEGKKIRREVKNLAVAGPPGVLVKLTDGTVIRRGGGLAQSGVPEFEPNHVVEGFEYSPLIVRRQDIESFWRVSENERQTFFFDYLQSYQTYRLRENQIKLKDDLQKAVDAHSVAVDQLVKLTRFSNPDLPARYGDTRRFLQRNLLPTYGVGTGAARQLPDRLYRSFLILQTTLKRKEELTTKINELPEPGPIIDREITRILQDLTVRVTADFVSISRLEWIREVTIVAGAESQLAITLILDNDKKLDPTQVLSEASLDLLALLILVEVHIKCAALGQNPVIVLDDVFQSVDTVNRIRALNHILSRLKNWQIIMTLHDRLWLELTRRAMHRVNYSYIDREVLPGDFGGTPQLRGAPGRSAEDLHTYIEQHESSETITGCAGRVLEELCEGLSITLASSIARRPGDRYTLGDLWPGVASSLRKHGHASIKRAVEDVGLFIDLRNIVGAHYNEWAATLSSQEAVEFGTATLALWKSCRCPTCRAFFSKLVSTDGKSVLYTWPCNCETQSKESQLPSDSD